MTSELVVPLEPGAVDLSCILGVDVCVGKLACCRCQHRSRNANYLCILPMSRFPGEYYMLLIVFNGITKGIRRRFNRDVGTVYKYSFPIN